MINLLKISDRYVVSFEESYNHAGELGKADPDFPLMYQVIEGKYGEIYAYDDEHLAVYVIGQNRHKKVSRLEGIQLLNDCEDEGVYLFRADNQDLFHTVANIIHAHKKRRLSEEQKALQVERLKEYRFSRLLDMQKSIQFYASKRLSGGNKAMILSLFISYYQLQILSLKKLVRTAFYDVLQAKHNKVESDCNSYVGDVVYPCTELTTFKTSNIKERRSKWV